MGDQPGQVKGVIDAGVGHPQFFAVHGGVQGQVDLAAVPGVPQLVRRRRHRREGGPWFGLIKAELLGQLRRDQIPEGDIVQYGEQLDVLSRLFRRHARRHIVGDGGHLGFEVNAPVLVLHRNVVAGADKRIGRAHVHQRVGPEGFRQLGPPRLAHQLNMGDIGAAVGPVVSAGQRRGNLFGVEIEGAGGPSVLQAGEGLNQGRLRLRPAV